MNKDQAIYLFREQWNTMANLYSEDPDHYVGENALIVLKYNAIQTMGFQEPDDIEAKCFCCEFLRQQQTNHNAPDCSETGGCIIEWDLDIDTDTLPGPCDPCLVAEYKILENMFEEQHTPVHDPRSGKLVKLRQHEPEEILAYIKKIANLPENRYCIWADEESINDYWVDHYHATERR